MAKGTPKSKGKNLPVKTGGVKGSDALSLIDPSEIALLQKGVFNVVKQNMPRVREVLQGTRSWNPQQVKLYLALLDKVMPTLNHSVVDDRRKDVNEMTPAELRALIAEETRKASAIDAMPTNDPDIPFEAQVVGLMVSPLMPD